MLIDYPAEKYWRACPPISKEDYERAILILPTYTGRNNTFAVNLDGNEETHVVFDWSEFAKAWVLRNRLMSNPAPVLVKSYCECSKMEPVDHIINSGVNKKKCKKCGIVSDIKVNIRISI